MLPALCTPSPTPQEPSWVPPALLGLQVSHSISWDGTRRRGFAHPLTPAFKEQRSCAPDMLDNLGNSRNPQNQMQPIECLLLFRGTPWRTQGLHPEKHTLSWTSKPWLGFHRDFWFFGKSLRVPGTLALGPDCIEGGEGESGEGWGLLSPGP